MPSPTEECHTGVAEQGGQQAGVGHGAQAADAAIIATCRWVIYQHTHCTCSTHNTHTHLHTHSILKVHKRTHDHLESSPLTYKWACTLNTNTANVLLSISWPTVSQGRTKTCTHIHTQCALSIWLTHAHTFKQSAYHGITNEQAKMQAIKKPCSKSRTTKRNPNDKNLKVTKQTLREKKKKMNMRYMHQNI